MNKKELINKISEEAGISKEKAAKALNAITNAIESSLAKDKQVTLVGFGTFKTSKRAARTGRNPQTGVEVKIAATNVPRFTPGAAFKARVSGKAKASGDQTGSGGPGKKR